MSKEIDYTKTKKELLKENIKKFIYSQSKENTLNMLIPYHAHAEDVYERNPDEIVYLEEDVMILLREMYSEAFQEGFSKGLNY